MSQGPTLIFDKSALQALSVDETNWLDNFFLTNITPLFLVETLADLEKEVASGRTPEEIVGHLALRTPDMQASSCMHHRRLIGGELLGHSVPMDSRIPCDSGKIVDLDGKRGAFFSRSKEEEALQRWNDGEFLDVERQIAKAWRRDLCDLDYANTYPFFQKWFHLGKPTTLAEVKTLTDALIDGSPQRSAFEFGLDLLGVPADRKREILERWEKEGTPAVRKFAPYFRYIYGVDLFFNLAISADQISRVRPAGKVDNRVDIAYLYYLPFCTVFTSNDRLHKRAAPLFLREDQIFIAGDELKADLRKLDDHYSALPDDIKNSGFHRFASHPPEDDSFLVTRLWDKYLPRWREIKAQGKQPDQSEHLKIMAELNRIEKAAESSEPNQVLSPDETEFVHIVRNVRRSKGKWHRFGPDVK